LAEAYRKLTGRIFISLYFSLVDHEAHTSGPTSKQTHKVLHTADSLLGMLMDNVATAQTAGEHCGGF
jgi:hypothetical protein